MSSDFLPQNSSEINSTARSEAEEMYEILLTTSPLVMNIWDEDITLVSTSQQSVKMFGLSNQEEYIENFNQLSPEFQPCGTRSSDKAVAFVKQAFRDGYVKFEWAHRAINGEEIPTEITIVRFTSKGKNKAVAYTVDLRQNVASVKRERALARELEMNAHLKVMLDSAPIAVCLYDLNLKLLDCNMEAVRMFAFTTHQGFMKGFNGKVLDFSADMQPGRISKTEKLKVVMEEAHSVGKTRFEWIHLSLTGEEIPADISLVRIPFRDSFALITYIHDLREIRAAKDKETVVTERVQLMLDAAPILIQYWDKDYNCTDCNQRALTFYGFKTKQEYFDGLTDALPALQPDGVPSWAKWYLFLDKIYNEGTSEIEFYEVDLNGESAVFEVFGLRTLYRDEIVAITYSTDVTQLKEVQKERQRLAVAEESNKAKSMFLARVSHEIRTPISSVLGITEIQMQNSNLPLEIEESFVRIHNASTMLLDIINDVLDLSKIEAGKMTIMKEKYELSNLISNSTHMHLSYFGNKEIQFNLHVDEDLPAILIGDSLRIEQVMNNLLSNAFKYTEKGSIDLIFQGSQGQEPETMALIITVKDTGYGMTQEQVSTIHNVYARFHENTSKYIGGTGLGMPIVYSLVQLMDAYIDINSQVGVGTSVTVHIPQRYSGSEVIGRERAIRLQHFEVDIKNALKRYTFSPERMPYGSALVVDDVEANLYVAKGLLSLYDIKVETCESGQEAIQKVKDGNVYDVVFMDHMMPEMNGVEAMQFMRSVGYNEPIVMLTANTQICQSEDLVKLGFDGFITKPILANHLNMILVKHIKSKQPPEVLKAAAKLPAPEKSEQELSTAMLEKLRTDFGTKHQNMVEDITIAIEDGEIDNAHLLAHSLKGLAMIIHEPRLARVAEQVEHLLEEEELPSAQLMADLEFTFNKVLKNIESKATPKTAAQTENFVKTFDLDKTLALLDKIEPLLEFRKAECIGMLGDLKPIPEAAIFVKQVQKFDFASAHKSLDVLRVILKEK